MTAPIPPAADRPAVARWMAECLQRHVMPYWCRTADAEHGGYRLRDFRESRTSLPWRTRFRRPPAGLSPPRKYLVSQGRMLYGLSLASRLGLGPSDGGCLRAAELGYRFLSQVMLDREHGGMIAVAEQDGTVVDDRKLLCQHTPVIYGLVEYHRAGGGEAPLTLALELFRTLHAHLYDRMYGGWLEHADRAFRPLRRTWPAAKGVVGVIELKSADSMLHWMEALAELYEATHDQEVGAALAESLHFNLTHFFPGDASVARRYLTRDWRPLGGSRYDEQSHGHNVEFAWLMWRVQEVLARPLDCARFDALVGHTLRHAFDHRRGGVFYAGREHRPASDRRKVWWVQAEMLSALCDRVRLFGAGGPEDHGALDRLVEWILRHQTLPEDGIWISVLDQEGEVLDLEKAGPWKDLYHDVRAMAKYLKAFA